LNNSTARGLWLAIIVLTAVLLGVSGGLLGWVGGLNAPTAVLTGGGAFGGAVMLGLAVLRFAAGAVD
jgi:hypothetical protein